LHKLEKMVFSTMATAIISISVKVLFTCCMIGSSEVVVSYLTRSMCCKSFSFLVLMRS
jgi:hypothetical protein